MIKTIRQYVLIKALPTRLRFALRYMVIHKRFSLLLSPRLFTEKLMLRVAIDRREIMEICADKMRMREYVKLRVGERFLPKLLDTTTNPEDIEWDKLPSKCVIKANHGSGWVRIITQPDQKTRQNLIAEFRGWLRSNFGLWSREWAYVNVRPLLMIEEFVESAYKDKDGIPFDFRFFVFNGKCEMVMMDGGQPPDRMRNLYSPNRETIECTIKYPPFKTRIDLPSDLNEMIVLAESVAVGIDFVRVDLYTTDKGPLIGELTMTHGGGGQQFSNLNFDRLLGSRWKMGRFRD